MIPGQVHSWDFKGDVDGYIINFSTTFFQSFLLKANYLEELPFFSGITKDAVIDIPEQLQDKVINLFEELMAENETISPLGLDMVKSLMLQLFILVARLNSNVVAAVTPSYNYTLLRSFQKLIEKNYMHMRLPKQYAELLYITPNHLNALCNDVLGIPAGEVIRNRIILEAKRLLINNDMTVLEIANHLNFADNSYFTKFFKKLEGVTPEEFRKKTNHDEHLN
jgi:AraC family transcriptional regulator, transcriptional activator of pobA